MPTTLNQSQQAAEASPGPLWAGTSQGTPILGEGLIKDHWRLVPRIGGVEKTLRHRRMSREKHGEKHRVPKTKQRDRARLQQSQWAVGLCNKGQQSNSGDLVP